MGEKSQVFGGYFCLPKKKSPTHSSLNIMMREKRIINQVKENIWRWIDQRRRWPTQTCWKILTSWWKDNCVCESVLSHPSVFVRLVSDELLSKNAKKSIRILYEIKPLGKWCLYQKNIVPFLSFCVRILPICQLPLISFRRLLIGYPNLKMGNWLQNGTVGETPHLWQGWVENIINIFMCKFLTKAV